MSATLAHVRLGVLLVIMYALVLGGLAGLILVLGLTLFGVAL